MLRKPCYGIRQMVYLLWKELHLCIDYANKFSEVGRSSVQLAPLRALLDWSNCILKMTASSSTQNKSRHEKWLPALWLVEPGVIYHILISHKAFCKTACSECSELEFSRGFCHQLTVLWSISVCSWSLGTILCLDVHILPCHLTPKAGLWVKSAETDRFATC